MAKATKRFETKYETKTVEVETKYIDLTLTGDEAKYLRAVLRKIGGLGPVRDALSAVQEALWSVGVGYDDYALTGSMSVAGNMAMAGKKPKPAPYNDYLRYLMYPPYRMSLHTTDITL